MDHEPKNGPIDVYVSDFGLAYHVLRKPTWWRKLWAATVGRIWWTWKLRRLFRQALREAVVEVAPAANQRVSGFAGIAKRRADGITPASGACAQTGYIDIR